MNYRVFIIVFSILLASHDVVLSKDHQFADFTVPAEQSFKPLVSKKTISELKGIEKPNGTTAYDYLNRKPNFAGHYEIVEWGCGTSCWQAVVINLKSGEIVDSIGSCVGLIYDINSSLLIEDGFADADIEECKVKRYHVLKNEQILSLK